VNEADVSQWVGHLSDIVPAIIALAGVALGTWLTNRNLVALKKSQETHQLRMAAIEHRLAVHQEAFSLWRNLVKVIYQANKLGDAVTACQKFWEDKCLYLDPVSREEFINGVQTAAIYADDIRQTPDARAEWRRLMAVGKYLVEGVGLPSIGDLEVDEPEAPKKEKT